jgi:membrane fusion protein (multidrug efflux system)
MRGVRRSFGVLKNGFRVKPGMTGRLFGNGFRVKPGMTGVFALALVLSACDSSDKAAVEVPPLAVPVTQASIQNVSLTTEMVGTTMGTQDVPIRTRVEGFLETMEFEEGTFVKKGDMLYTIDPQPFLAKLVGAQSELAGAQTTHARTESDLARIRPLAEIKAVSEQDLDSAVAQEAAADASVRASEANVELAEIELSYARIKAPIDGLIGLTKAKPGEFVGREPNPVVLNTLSDIDPIRVRFSISEREYLMIARHYTGRKERMGEDGARERKADLILLLADGSEHPYKGMVIAGAQSISAETGTYTLEASFPNPNNVLLPGQFARVRANYQELENVVVIPRKAVVEIQGRFSVYMVNQQNQVEVVEIELGPVIGNDVVINSGLKGGETIILEGLQKVRPGAKVIPQPVKA